MTSPTTCLAKTLSTPPSSPSWQSKTLVAPLHARVLTRTIDCDLHVRTSSFWTLHRPEVRELKSVSGTCMQRSIRNSNLSSPNSKTSKARRDMWNDGKLKSYISTSSSLANAFIVVTFNDWLLTLKTSPRFFKWQRSSILTVRQSLI